MSPFDVDSAAQDAAQDPPDDAAERARLAAAGFSPAEIAEHFARRGGGRPTAPTPPRSAAESWTPRGKAVAGVRAVGQGLTFGFGDEAEALVTSLVRGTPYDTEAARIRDEMAAFREGYPKTALAAELAGGIATAAGMGRAALTGVKGASQIARALAKSATAQGALGGAGAAEGGLAERATGAAVGGAVGGTVGALAGKAAGSAAEWLGTRGAKTPASGVVVRALESARMTPDAAVARARQLATDAPEARVLDVLGTPGVREARRIEALGGEAGERINAAMTERLASRPQRFQDALTRTTGRPTENVLETLEDLVQRRKAAADPAYARVYAQPPVVDDALEAVLRNPGMKGPIQRATELLGVEERPVAVMTRSDGTTEPVRSPAFLDAVKKALDDAIYRGKQPGEGGLGPAMLGALKQLRGRYVETLDAAIPGYAEARAVWAGETALKDAMEEGLAFATKRTDPRAVAQTLAEMTDGEREMVQRGWLDGIRQRIDNDALTPKQLRAPAFRQQVAAVFGDDADAITAALAEELQLTTTAGQVIGGSRTAPLARDMTEDAPLTGAARGLLTTREVVRDPLGAAARGVDWLGAQVGGPRAAQARVAQADALLTPAREIEDVMAAVRRAARARAAGAHLARRVAPTVGGVAGRRGVELLRQ